MKFKFFRLALAALFCCAAVTAQASFVIVPDTDGLDDAVLVPHPNFSLGGNTTGPRSSVYATVAPYDPGTNPPVVGTIGFSDSVFGSTFDSDPLPHEYRYSYTPGVDGDNTTIAAGTDLNDDGDNAAGLPAGSSGRYRIYATWPQTNNVSGGDTRYILNDGISDIATADIDQNEDTLIPAGGGVGLDGNLKGGEWEFLFELTLDANTTYTLRQNPTVANGFVSMRSGGVLFELVPEPTSALLTMAGALCLAAVRRRRS